VTLYVANSVNKQQYVDHSQVSAGPELAAAVNMLPAHNSIVQTASLKCFRKISNCCNFL